MLEKAERILMQDAHEVNKNTESIRGTKLSTVVRVGIAQGRKREMRRIYTYGISAVAAAAAAILIIYSSIGSPTKEVEEHIVQTASANKVTEFELFRPIAKRDQGFAAALEQGLVKPIKQGVEKNGYRVDVAGAVTDGRNAYVMFSVQNLTDHEVSPIVDSLSFGGIEALNFGAEAKAVMSNYDILAGQTAYYVYKANLLPSADYKKDAKFNVKIWDTVTQKYQKGLNVTFELEPNMLKAKERVFNPERTMTVDGQHINVHQVRFTPLNTYLDVEYDKANDKQIFKLINPVLIGKKGDRIEKLYYPLSILSESDSSKVTLVFKNNKFDQLDSTSLKIAGIAAVNKDQLKVVVDINKKQILEAPDANLKLIQSDQQIGTEEVVFQFNLKHAPAVDSIGMWLDDSFTDAKGTKHKRLSPIDISHGGHSYSSKEGTIQDETSYNFGKEALDYPQPLTIEVKKYWIPIMEAQDLELLSKN